MPHSLKFTPDMVGQDKATTINSAKPSKNSAKPSNTLSIEANATDTPLIAWKFKPEDTRTDDDECNLWMFGADLALLRDTLRSVGYAKKLDDLKLCQIALRLLRGQGYRFKANGKIYAVNPNFQNLLRAYYYKLKAENPTKLNDCVLASDLNILVVGGDE
jgi:hypothetical protein